MPLIASAAHFKVCQNCGRHGKIVLADGDESSLFLTKYAALEEAKSLLRDKYITEFEMPELRRQIEESSLIYRNDEAEEAWQQAQLMQEDEGMLANEDESADDEYFDHSHGFDPETEPNPRTRH